MQPSWPPSIPVRFGPFQVDLRAAELRKRGRKVPLQDQPFKVLALLLRRPGELVTRDELQRALWPSDTFGEFDEGLNKAVQKLRQALDDSSDNPRFIETLPRKGYRFIAALESSTDEDSAQPAPVHDSAVSTSGVGPAKQRETEVLPWLMFGIVSLALLALAGVYVWHIHPTWWRSKPGNTAVRQLTRLTSNGVSRGPTISPDGKMLAYLSSLGGPNQDIWVQQIGGGNAIQITHEKEGASSPVFSPDGTHIAYASHGDIYEVPALGGDSRLITSDGFGPVYATGGSTIVFARIIEGWYRLFTIARIGGSPVAIHPEVALGSTPVVSPDGSKVLALASRKERQDQDLKRWWMIPILGGKLEEVVPPPLLAGETRAPAPSAWTAVDRNPRFQWVTFERPTGDTHNLFRVAITSDGNVTSDPEQLTFATGLATSPSVSESGRMVFDSSTRNTNLWSIPIDTDHARVTGEPQRLTQVEGVRDDAPSLSHDGKRVAFFSGNRLAVKDLVTGRETQLVPDFLIHWGSAASISPDGTLVAYYVWNGSRSLYDIYLISATGGIPRLLCQSCGGPVGFSSDGTRILIENFGSGLDRISLAELATGKITDVLIDPQHQLWNAFYSWDDKWMAFLMQTGADEEHNRIYITPVQNFIPAGPDRWIQLTNGDYYDDHERLSPDGNTMYFTSNRDGFSCIWALRLDPKTKHPQGPPFAIQHFHGSQRIYSGISETNHMEVNVAKDKIVTNLDEFHSDIWMMELESGK